MNSQHLEVGGVGIAASINPGPPVLAGLAVADRDTYLLNHMLQRAQWENITVITYMQQGKTGTIYITTSMWSLHRYRIPL